VSRRLACLLAAAVLAGGAASAEAAALAPVRQAGACVAVVDTAQVGAGLTLRLLVQRHPADCGCRSKMMAVTLEDAAGAIVGEGRFVLEPDLGERTLDVALAAHEGGPATRISVGCAGE